MTTQPVQAPKPSLSPSHSQSLSRFFFNPDDTRLPKGVVVMQALGVAAVVILGFGPVSAILIGLATGGIAV